MRNTISLDTEVLILHSRKLKGFSHKEHPQSQHGSERVPLSELLDPSFAVNRSTPDDMYVVPGIHETGTFRILKDDVMFYNKDKYSFSHVALDLDWHVDDGRSTWDSKDEPAEVIHEILKKSPLMRKSICVSSSRGGIRAIFLLDKTLNAPEWQNFYDNMETELLKDFQGYRINNKVSSFHVGDYELHMDRRNPYSLTRVPYGYRDGEQVVNSKYFYTSRNNGNILPIDYFGEPTEAESLPFKVKGYTRVSISYDNRRPIPTKEPKLPVGIYQFEWPNGEIPTEGGREYAIWKAVNEAKTHYKDRMTPEQYFTYFKSAISQMDASTCIVHPLDQLWLKITKDWLKRDDGGALDEMQMNSSGNTPLYLPDEFDNALRVTEVYDYAIEKSLEYTEDIIDQTSGCAFLNPPAGAGKSTAAIEVLKRRGGIYVAPSNKQLTDFVRKFDKRVTVNLVLSYKALIPIVAEGDEELIAILTDLYDSNYTLKRPEAQKQVDKYNAGDFTARRVPLVEVRGRFWGVASFPNFLKKYGKKQYFSVADKMHRENVNRMAKLEEGQLSVLTHNKLLYMCSRDGVRALPESHLIMFDECSPIDIVDPEIYLQAPPAEVYGSLQKTPLMEEPARQAEFCDLLRKHCTVFINADRGLERALEHNGYGEVKMYGRDMNPIVDEDLHVVLSPSLKAGFTPHKNKKDLREYSPRAIYAQSVNSKIYTLITNGKDAGGESLAGKNNLVTMVGSNDFLNSKVISMLTSPTPHQVAELMYATGLSEKGARKLLFQNQINQVISRNVGYRCLEVVNRYRAKKGELPEVHDNKHILVLPASTINDEFDIIVKTPNVWTVNSPNPPAFVQSYLKPVNEITSLRGTLYSLAPGEIMTIRDFSELIRKDVAIARRIFLEAIEDDMLSDFTYIKDQTIRGVRHRNSIYRCHTLKVVMGECIDNLEGRHVTLKEFSDILKEATTERYMKSISAKDRKDFISKNAFRFDYRLIRTKRGMTLVPTDEVHLFR